MKLLSWLRSNKTIREENDKLKRMMADRDAVLEQYYPVATMGVGLCASVKKYREATVGSKARASAMADLFIVCERFEMMLEDIRNGKQPSITG